LCQNKIGEFLLGGFSKETKHEIKVRFLAGIRSRRIMPLRTI
jgi:hypothetical protein